jgi:hypothetical protein
MCDKAIMIQNIHEQNETLASANHQLTEIQALASISQQQHIAFLIQHNTSHNTIIYTNPTNQHSNNIRHTCERMAQRRFVPHQHPPSQMCDKAIMIQNIHEQNETLASANHQLTEIQALASISQQQHIAFLIQHNRPP